MQRALIFSGILGLLFGSLIFFASCWAKNFISTLLPGFVLALTIFFILLFIALLEMPVMVYAIRTMARQATAPIRLIAAIFGFYVLFAAVYAAILILLADSDYNYFGITLAVLGIVRFISGIFIR